MAELIDRNDPADFVNGVRVRNFTPETLAERQAHDAAAAKLPQADPKAAAKAAAEAEAEAKKKADADAKFAKEAADYEAKLAKGETPAAEPAKSEAVPAGK